MFHSIKKNDLEKVVWEEGSWTSDKLDKLLCFLDNKKILIIGAGQTGELTLQNFSKKNFLNLSLPKESTNVFK